MHDENRDKERDEAALIAAIEAELAALLAEEHGVQGVRVRLDRDAGIARIANGEPVSDRLLQGLLPVATRRAIIRRVRERERGEQ